MIHVDRAKSPAPDSLVNAGKKELAKNILKVDKQQYKSQVFLAYRQSDVKKALVELFKGKCAYCESAMLETYPGDVEHFRPKGAISGADHDTHGYYWLAADWNNLLLSCRNCNQTLTHEIFGGNVSKVMGKMNQFPLFNGQRHLNSHTESSADIAAEEQARLLVNPCKDKPEDLFSYDEVHGTIKPKMESDFEKQKALTSIEVFVLQRVPLVQARRKLLIQIFAQIDRVMQATKQVSGYLENGDLVRKNIWDAILLNELRFLKSFTLPEASYAGMARQIINNFIQEKFNKHQ